MTEGFQPRRLFSYLIILAIAVVFILQFGPGSRGCDVHRVPTVSAATVNGKEIPVEELNRVYAQQLMSIRARLGGKGIGEDVLRQLVKPEQVLERMVDGELLSQAAEREGVVASDTEVRDFLHRNPDFQREGKFDYGRYTDVLRQYYRRTPSSYETEVRRQLSAAKLVETVQAGAVVSEDEVKTRFRREGDRAELEFVRFFPAMYADQVKAPSASEVQAYEASHAAQIAKEYASNKLAYRKPEQVHVRQILVKLGPTDADKAKARERMEGIRKEVEGGKNFAQAALTYSEDEASKASGGDLGFKAREDSGWPPAFARQAFTLQAGKVSETIETPLGLHLLKVEERKPAVDLPFEAVKTKIAEQLLKRELAQQKAKAAAEAAFVKAKAGKKLGELFPASETPGMEFTASSKPEATKSGSFAVSDAAIPKLGAAPAILGAVRKASEPGLLPELFPMNDGFILAALIERHQPQDSEYQAQRDKLYEEALQGKRMELQDGFLKAVKKAATVVTHEQALAPPAS